MSTTEMSPSTPVAAALPNADPAALGLAAFGLTTFVLSFANAGFIEGAGVTVLGLAIFFGGLGQLIAGAWEFVNKNTFGATAFTSYGAFWLAAWYLLTSGHEVDADGVGVFFLAWTIFTAYMTIAALRTNTVVLLVFIALTLTFLFLTLHEFTGTDVIGHVAGYLGIITALLAFYGSAATVTNATFKKVVLPVGPRA